ncbi:hypothetical protein IOD06_12500 [Psychrobacter sp. N25K4-3-2]|uniref:hypothetical protein n=1 Tax=Psychrobacter sp. N25K4-3-2 TaxID=2785026 RepID=UPI00188C6704|nr:hypothetical protein [Psychrobacter sp. N25K4-3-2]MBF4490708.1 hypothetical protein [Psychrobacter sp. N25K4-3-2]
MTYTVNVKAVETSLGGFSYAATSFVSIAQMPINSFFYQDIKQIVINIIGFMLNHPVVVEGWSNIKMASLPTIRCQNIIEEVIKEGKIEEV